uniref:DIRP domain-containing protein n=1 Tax=Peronospora matthiolae TaxID=2874970 RepID=A0AAV1U7H3_9STRA
MQSEQVLGPRWSLEELQTFYLLLKTHGKQWDKLTERLPQRSCGMVRALFDMHRGYLSLSEASVEGFCAIMMDHYDVQDKQGRLLANEKLKRNKTDFLMLEQGEEATRKWKKRRLEILLTMKPLKTPQLQREEQERSRERSLSVKRGRNKAVPKRARAWLIRELSVDGEDKARLGVELGVPRFDLPWSHWFYSHVDVAFFTRNEFIECLDVMGLGKITSAGRSTWSSVRASMGRPRRLSPLFFAQERQKLEAYRSVKRHLDSTHMLDDKTWPYRSTAPLFPGTTVIAWVESKRCFQLATVVVAHDTAGACQVVHFGSELQTDVVERSLDNVMTLNFPLWSWRSKADIEELKVASTTLLRRNDGVCKDTSTVVTSKAVDPSDERYRDDKCRALLAVKALLHRKEQIVVAMAHLNERVTEMQMRLHEKNAMQSNARSAPTVYSSTAVKDLVWANSRMKQQLKKQYSWLAANLDATNGRLRAALLSLQSFSKSGSHGEENADTNVAEAADTLEWSSAAQDETLTESEMRWAIDFLAASQRKAAAVVTEMVHQIAQDEKELTKSSKSTSAIRRGEVLPETMQLVTNCVTLMSVLHRHVAASPDVPAVVTQKLLQRVLELLKPTYTENMDLYAELHAAVDAAQAQMTLQASTSKVDYTG